MGIVKEKKKDGKIVYSGGRTEVLEYGITEIPKAAYSNNDYIISVVLPNSVKTIGEGAFEWCCNLTVIEIPESVTMIYDDAFKGCEALTSIEIPGGVKLICSGVFSRCTNLKVNISPQNKYYKVIENSLYTYDGKKLIEYLPRENEKFFSIPSGVTEIETMALLYGDNLTSIEIPSSLTKANGFELNGCNNIRDIYYGGTKKQWRKLSIGQWNKYIANATIHCAVDENLCASGASMQMPARKDGKIIYIGGREEVLEYGITEIKENAYFQNEDIVSVVLPSSVTTIDYMAFACCNSLRSIEIPGSVTVIGESAFYKCRNLKSVEIPGSVTVIDDTAFAYCSSLKSIEIPDSVTMIGTNAFCWCNSLTSIEIPNNVTAISSSAFYSCEKLTSVEMPDSIKTIDNNAFGGCCSLTSIRIPGGVTAIGGGAFEACRNLKSIEIPDSVTTVGDNVFSYCDNLTDIYYGGSMFKWMKVQIGKNNRKLNGIFGHAKIHYKSK